MFKDGKVPIMLIKSLLEGGPHIGQNVRCKVIIPKNVKRLIGFEHKRLYFIVQAATIDCSRWVSIDQFRDDML